VAGEAEVAVAGDELAPGPEVHGMSSSGVLCGEGKVGVWFPGSDDDGVVGKGGDGESRAQKSGIVWWPSRKEEGRRLPRTDTATGDARAAAACAARGVEVASWLTVPVRCGGSGHAAVTRA
jgi:hypothetical protein